MTIDELVTNLFCTKANLLWRFRRVLLDDELSNVLPNSYGALAKSKYKRCNAASSVFGCGPLSCRCRAVVAMVYYGVGMVSTDLAGDVYLNFILTMLIEIPAYVLCSLFINP